LLGPATNGLLVGWLADWQATTWLVGCCRVGDGWMTRGALTETRRDDGHWIIDGRAAAGWTGEIRHSSRL